MERWRTLERETLPSPKDLLLLLFLYNEALIPLRRSLELCKEIILALLLRDFNKRALEAFLKGILVWHWYDHWFDIMR